MRCFYVPYTSDSATIILLSSGRGASFFLGEIGAKKTVSHIESLLETMGCINAIRTPGDLCDFVESIRNKGGSNMK